VIFKFAKIREEELVLADKLKNTLRQTREALADNFDQQDPKFITLREELERLFKKKKLSEVSQEEMTANIGALNAIHDKVKELNRQNKQLRAKYRGDAKAALHRPSANCSKRCLVSKHRPTNRCCKTPSC